MLKVLVVGQTPPPFGGQAAMIQMLLEGHYQSIKLYHVRMAFSKEMDEIGRVRLGKVFHLFAVIGRIWWNRFRHGIRVLYYPPAGPDRVPIYRDMVILLATRWLFTKVVFHFHAGGLTDILPRLTLPERILFRCAYSHPTCGIQLASGTPPDAERLEAERRVVIPYGLHDLYPSYVRSRAANCPPRILFMGVLRASKGVMVLLEASRQLKSLGVPFSLELVGRFQSPAFEAEVRRFTSEAQLLEHVSFPGVRTGPDKWDCYARADLFCFPTYFESEGLSVVVLEAMMFALPVVATQWRGIPSLVREGETGHLVAVRDAKALADRMAKLLANAEERQRMGQRGREIFLQDFTADHWRSQMEDALAGCAEAPMTTAGKPRAERIG